MDLRPSISDLLLSFVEFEGLTTVRASEQVAAAGCRNH